MQTTVPVAQYTVLPVPVGAGRSLTDADHGRLLEVSATLTLTVPDTLMAGFACSWHCTGNAVLTLDPTGSATINDSAASIATPGPGALYRLTAAGAFGAAY